MFLYDSKNVPEPSQIAPYAVEFIRHAGRISSKDLIVFLKISEHQFNSLIHYLEARSIEEHDGFLSYMPFEGYVPNDDFKHMFGVISSLIKNEYAENEIVFFSSDAEQALSKIYSFHVIKKPLHRSGENPLLEKHYYIIDGSVKPEMIPIYKQLLTASDSFHHKDKVIFFLPSQDFISYVDVPFELYFCVYEQTEQGNKNHTDKEIFDYCFYNNADEKEV